MCVWKTPILKSSHICTHKANDIAFAAFEWKFHNFLAHWLETGHLTAILIPVCSFYLRKVNMDQHNSLPLLDILYPPLHRLSALKTFKLFMVKQICTMNCACVMIHMYLETGSHWYCE